MSRTTQKLFAVIVGARPNFIKAAPFLARLKAVPHIRVELIHTGQHYDQNMSAVFFDEMGIQRPDVILESSGVSGSQRLGVMICQLSEVLAQKTYDGVVVFGDIDSTLAGAVAAKALGIPLVHVEAGLRSHDKRMPEEKNRIIVDHLSDVLFTTEPVAVENLLAEGIPEDRIFPVGNLMIESLELFRPLIERSDALSALDLTERGYVVATVHRVENTSDPDILKKILLALASVHETHPVVLPLHPGTRSRIEEAGLIPLLAGIKVVEPLGYFDFLKLVSGSGGVITDSGGIQEETSHLGIACATLRDNTERPITIERGSNILVPLSALEAALIIEHLAKSHAPAQIPLWDKEVSVRIFEVLDSRFE